MEQNGEFRKVDRTDNKMYGPRGLLVCGYPEEERILFLDFIKKISMNNIPVIFATNDVIEKNLGELLTCEHKAGTGPSELPRTVIMSGLSQNELHTLMGEYRKEGFSNQLWATLTPTSESWPLKSLLRELLAEAKAMQKKQQ